LALLQYPVRCRNCGRRTYANLLLVIALYRLRFARRVDHLFRVVKKAQ
jgi:hypothetical protein